MTAELDLYVAQNYELLVESGDRTWADVAAMADAEGSPALATYARERASAQLPPAPVVEKRAPAPERPAPEKPAPDPAGR